MFLLSSCTTCSLCRLNIIYLFSSFCLSVFLCMDDLNGKTIKQIQSSNKSYNCSLIYYSHHKIIKYISFESIHYAINLDIASSSIIFRGFESVFQSNVFLV